MSNLLNNLLLSDDLSNVVEVGKNSNHPNLPVEIEVHRVPLCGIHVSQDGVGYISFYHDGVFQTESLRSKKSRHYIRHVFYKKYGKLLTESAIHEVVEQIAAECEYCGDRVSLAIRTAKFGSEIFIDGINKVYKISMSGWQEQEVYKPIFTRPQGMLELVNPITGGDLKKIFNLVHITDENKRLLFLVHIVASLIPDVPIPPLILYGPKGASKSTALRFYCKLVDPNLSEDVPFRNEKEFMLAAEKRRVVGIDNASYIKSDVSDIYCKLVSGASYVSRALYTDDDLIIKNFRRVLVINGVSLPVSKSDLLDRCLLMPLERVSGITRKTEDQLNSEFEKMKGELLGGCFDVLVKAMQIRPFVVLESADRMADFQHWGCAIAQALGYTQEYFLKAWKENTLLQLEEVIEASPIASLIGEWFKVNYSRDSLLGTPTHILAELRNIAENIGIDLRSLPMSSLSFGRKIDEIRTDLEAYGYIIQRSRGKNRTITIHKPNREHTEP